MCTWYRYLYSSCHFLKISSTCPVESEYVGNLPHTPTKGPDRQEGHHPQPHDGGVHRPRQDPQLEDC
jgi:hypothetical protein